VLVGDNHAGSYGGGLYFNSYPSDVENSTFSANTAVLGGGGIYSATDGNLRLKGVTVVENSTSQGDGGGIATPSGVVRSQHTVIANNLAPNGVGPDCQGDLSDEFGVLIGDPAGCVISSGAEAVITGVNPRLGALALNAGFSASHLPLYDSPLIDAGSVGECAAPGWSGLLADQREAERPAGGSQGICDIGAVEVQPSDDLYAVDCMTASTSWSPVSRGFFLEDFPGGSLRKVELLYQGGVVGWYRISLVARLGSYSGDLIGSVGTEQIWLPRQGPVVFDFEDVAVPQGSTIAFTQAVVQAPVGEPDVSYNDGSCPQSSGEACATCPGLYQTEHSTGALGAIRQGGVAVRISVPEPSRTLCLLSVLPVIALLARARREFPVLRDYSGGEITRLTDAI
jgi:predicted outer membrane repeat protein